MVRRLSVVGISGSGKTSLSLRLAVALGVQHIELDAMFHQPGWAELPPAEFRRRVEVAIQADGWVVDGNYSAVRDLVWAAADTVVWLDLPRSLVMRRVLGRTVARAVTRRELWNGNRETWRNTFASRDSLFVWMIRAHRRHRREWPARYRRDPRLVRLRTGDEVRRWLDEQTGRSHHATSPP